MALEMTEQLSNVRDRFLRRRMRLLGLWPVQTIAPAGFGVSLFCRMMPLLALLRLPLLPRGFVRRYGCLGAFACFRLFGGRRFLPRAARFSQFFSDRFLNDGRQIFRCQLFLPS